MSPPKATPTPETNETESDHDQATESAGGEAGHDESTDEEQILGVDVESPGAVVLAVAASLALAVGLWIRNERWLAIAAVGVASLFAVFDVAEIAHQVDESQTGLAVLAVVVAAGHLAAAAAAGLSMRHAI